MSKISQGAALRRTQSAPPLFSCCLHLCTALHCTIYTQITHCFSSATTTQVIVPGKYRRDFEDIQDRFAQLFDEVAEILENEESVTPERLKTICIQNSRDVPFAG